MDSGVDKAVSDIERWHCEYDSEAAFSICGVIESIYTLENHECRERRSHAHLRPPFFGC